MTNKQKIYKDTIHGFEALASSKNLAWMLIRNECKKMKLQVPTFDKIIEVKKPILILDDGTPLYFF
jgi:hypothetical protein